MSANSPSSSRRQRRSSGSSRRRHRHQRPRTTSLSGTDHTPSDHLKSSDIVTQSSSTTYVVPPANILRATYPHRLLKAERSEGCAGIMNSGAASSLPDLHKSGSGSLRFERSVIENEVCFLAFMSYLVSH
ncbi:unnamed protein product [Rodentolepis nana]|uniref:ORF3 n=1 Tax=Rodentolepis nana TaxID=102285 RepID=A0A0R3TH37_RODNA|nr:unnamed protein product [Rodentolepis nana]